MTKTSRQKRRKIYANKRPAGPMKNLKNKNKDQKVFSALPNEIILHVFSYLKIVDLLRCGQVSKRFRAISNDEYVWPKKFNLCYEKVVPAGFFKNYWKMDASTLASLKLS